MAGVKAKLKFQTTAQTVSVCNYAFCGSKMRTLAAHGWRDLQ